MSKFKSIAVDLGKGNWGGVLMIKCCKRSFHRKTWTFQWTKHFNRSFGLKENDFHFDCYSLAPPKTGDPAEPSCSNFLVGLRDPKRTETTGMSQEVNGDPDQWVSENLLF